ncbi:sugar phosphate isomerase/epimerase family protein [Rhodococcus artemisiae]|uniref:Sugar phosphate isomerase/epimerase family protein n=1 Tax=Rhodococcus artemisiae TaxID=714159 RepID=A0ABU7LCS3_9NOCA|nr:sugar phosphate isomerase/epimerase family protein [Rhodococcus artemisiae]MEE2059062.1 sugar phosphate isomerase/epimerase family protein [Rhodococcus artemisiae]
MATVSLGGSLEDKLIGIATAGFDAVELLDEDLRQSGLSPSECGRLCADLGLTIDLYQPFRRAEGVSPDEFVEVRARFDRDLGVMKSLGSDAILVVSNTDDDADSNRNLSVSQVSALAVAAAEQGMTVMFEALAWGTHINRVLDAWDVVRDADQPNLVLVVDTFHLIAGGEDASVLNQLPDNSVGFLQVADAPWLSMDLKQWSRNHRCFPGSGAFDLASPVAAAISNGYRGAISLEIFNPEYRALPPAVVAERGAQSLDELVGQLPGLGVK